MNRLSWAHQIFTNSIYTPSVSTFWSDTTPPTSIVTLPESSAHMFFVPQRKVLKNAPHNEMKGKATQPLRAVLGLCIIYPTDRNPQILPAPYTQVQSHSWDVRLLSIVHCTTLLWHFCWDSKFLGLQYCPQAQHSFQPVLLHSAASGSSTRKHHRHARAHTASLPWLEHYSNNIITLSTPTLGSSYKRDQGR